MIFYKIYIFKDDAYFIINLITCVAHIIFIKLAKSALCYHLQYLFDHARSAHCFITFACSAHCSYQYRAYRAFFCFQFRVQRTQKIPSWATRAIARSSLPLTFLVRKYIVTFHVPVGTRGTKNSFGVLVTNKPCLHPIEEL